MNAPGPAYSLYTFGYHNSTPVDLVQFAGALGGALVVDVRLSATSQHHCWRRPRLHAFLAESGITYRWTPELGNRNYTNPLGPIVLSDPEAGITRLWPHLARRQPLILLCLCPDPQTCHRSLVAAMLAAALSTHNPRPTVVHLPPRFPDWRPPTP